MAGGVLLRAVSPTRLAAGVRKPSAEIEYGSPGNPQWHGFRALDHHAEVATKENARVPLVPAKGTKAMVPQGGLPRLHRDRYPDRTPCSEHALTRRPCRGSACSTSCLASPARAARSGHPSKARVGGSLLRSIAAGRAMLALSRTARLPWRYALTHRTAARTSMSGRSSRCDLPLASRSLLPLHPRRSSACAQGVAGHGWPAKACHDTDVVSGRPRAQALRRGPARQGRRGCGMPSLWFLSLGKQRKEPAPGEIIRPELLASQVRNPSACGEWVSQLRRLLRATKQSVLPHGGLHHA